jgi:hypothetical protein
LKAAQERGEVATRADGTAIRDHVQGADKVATLPEIGIPRQRAGRYSAQRKEHQNNLEGQNNTPSNN